MKKVFHLDRMNAPLLFLLLLICSLIDPAESLAEADLLIVMDDVSLQSMEEIADRAVEEGVQIEVFSVNGVDDIIKADGITGYRGVRAVCLMVGSHELSNGVPARLLTDKLGFVRGEFERRYPGATVAWFPLDLEPGGKAQLLRDYRDMALVAGLINLLEVHPSFDLRAHFIDGQLNSAARQEIAAVLMAWYRMVSQ